MWYTCAHENDIGHTEFVDRMMAAGYKDQGQITLSCEKSFSRLQDTEVIS